MAYGIILSPAARRDLQRVPPRIVRAIVEFMYGDLSKNPRRVGKALRRELAGYHSAHRGPYRVIYSINDETAVVEVLRIDHRADVYKPR
ncbi:type II toxin-antitoxin system RelE family toxin [Specibacter cremeus]|uniref:type II toxin-antitoxin system RelE family toxin n=1 Tax=Specibacter cremeus TaxID=1629051 RepID=UPI000F7888A0|nr:type II toxin-antitoxin system RelE/ParE family toxin [Specibacter cremeus]